MLHFSSKLGAYWKKTRHNVTFVADWLPSENTKATAKPIVKSQERGVCPMDTRLFLLWIAYLPSHQPKSYTAATEYDALSCSNFSPQLLDSIARTNYFLDAAKFTGSQGRSGFNHNHSLGHSTRIIVHIYCDFCILHGFQVHGLLW